jgi:hypothetical protein
MIPCPWIEIHGYHHNVATRRTGVYAAWQFPFRPLARVFALTGAHGSGKVHYVGLTIQRMNAKVPSYDFPPTSCRASPGVGGRPADSGRGHARVGLLLHRGYVPRGGRGTKCLVLRQGRGQVLLREVAIRPWVLLLPSGEERPEFRLPVRQEQLDPHARAGTEHCPDRDGQDVGLCQCFAGDRCGGHERCRSTGHSSSLFAVPDLPGASELALSTRRLILRWGGMLRAHG